MIHADGRLKAAAEPLIDEARQISDILTTIKLNTEQRAQKEDEPT
jgi:hypothetical protein